MRQLKRKTKKNSEMPWFVDIVRFHSFESTILKAIKRKEKTRTVQFILCVCVFHCYVFKTFLLHNQIIFFFFSSAHFCRFATVDGLVQPHRRPYLFFIGVRRDARSTDRGRQVQKQNLIYLFFFLFKKSVCV